MGVCDYVSVRMQPYSRRYPDYKRRQLINVKNAQHSPVRVIDNLRRRVYTESLLCAAHVLRAYDYMHCALQRQRRSERSIFLG